MKVSKFSEAQIAFVLKQAEDGTSIAEVCRKAGGGRWRFISMDCSPFASGKIAWFDGGRLQTSIRRHCIERAQMGYPHTYASTIGRLL